MKRMGFRIGTEEDRTKQVIMPCDFQHGICIGMTGSGKTASLILPVMKERLERGHGILAYTYKGHEHRKIKHLAKQVNRLEDVIEIGKPHGQYMNLMASLELDAVKQTLQELISGFDSDKGDYWSLSAARLGTNVVDILRKLHKVDRLITNELGSSRKIRNVLVKELSDDTHPAMRYEYPEGEPSFKTLAEIVKSPMALKRFYEGLESVTKNIRNVIKAKETISYRRRRDYALFDDEDNLMEGDEDRDNNWESFAKKVTIALLRLEKSIAPYKDYSIKTDADENSGNNGVLQILNNAVLSLANKDYINIADIDLLESLNNGAIVIIDIEGIESDIHGVLLESILSKLSTRIRNGKPLPVSVFVDEANRVLLGDMDIHNDTLRESNVELILAVQNEEQMIEKFGETKWESIRKNFKHNYWISQEHEVTYNDDESWKAEALLISTKSLINAEYEFNALNSNQKIFEERFEFYDELPEKFVVEYDIVHFEKEMSMYLVDEKYSRKEVEYIGKELKQKLEKEMMRLGYAPKIEFELNI